MRIREEKMTFIGVTFSPDGVGGWTPLMPIAPQGSDYSVMSVDDINDGYLGFTKWGGCLWWLGNSFDIKFVTPSMRQGIKMPSASGRSWAAFYGSNPDELERGPISIHGWAGDDRRSPDEVARDFPGLDFMADHLMHSEIYEAAPFCYEGIYFIVPTVFSISGRSPTNEDGAISLSLAFSRDRSGASGWTMNGGDHFEPVLDHGRWGEWDSIRTYSASSLVVVNDQIVLYYAGYPDCHSPKDKRASPMGPLVHRSAVGRATMRLDGMASLHAGVKSAIILTKRLRFEGKRLVVNAQGELAAEILDDQGRVVPNFDRTNCIPFRGDALRHSLTWKDGDLAGLAGKVIQIRFYLKDGDLYSYGFAPPLNK